MSQWRDIPARTIRRRRRRLIGCTLLPAALALTACGNGVEPGVDSSGRVVSLRVLDYYTNQPDTKIYQRLYAACGRRLGIRIDRESVAGAGYMPRVLQQAASRTLPDVLMLDNPDLQQIASVGALAPIADFGLSTKGYARGVVASSTYRGKVYGLQPAANTLALFYNKKLLKEAGVEPPGTWSELRRAARELTGSDTYGMGFSAVATYEGAWQFLPFMWSNGGTERNLATPATAQAVGLWRDLVADGSAPKSVVNWSQADVNDQFKNGNLAMMVNGPWQLPLLDEAHKKKGLEFGVAKIPVPEGKKTSVAPLGGETFTLPQTGDRRTQKKAARFVACMNSERVQLKLGRLRDLVPARTDLAERLAADDPRLRAFVEQVRAARARTALLGPAWPKAATRIYTALQTALTGGATPTQAVRQAQND
ncbi:extracellular solute-binding protein [Streptomyces sp. NPDC102381]|uniref:sugar ABC transporter substrate-binding protein n=1 Tax=Streptomyces sp. NPDC102381 TaxID=3366164 RepID=UPI0038259FC3